MLYKFKSKATGDLIMLEPNGRQILQIIGKEAAPQGIVQTQEMPAAIAALEQAVKEAEVAQQDACKADQDTDGTASKSDVVTLRQRALPFIEMLKRCHAEGCNIVWGV